MLCGTEQPEPLRRFMCPQITMKYLPLMLFKGFWSFYILSFSFPSQIQPWINNLVSKSNIVQQQLQTFSRHRFAKSDSVRTYKHYSGSVGPDVFLIVSLKNVWKPAGRRRRAAKAFLPVKLPENGVFNRRKLTTVCSDGCFICYNLLEPFQAPVAKTRWIWSH